MAAKHSIEPAMEWRGLEAYHTDGRLLYRLQCIKGRWWLSRYSLNSNNQPECFGKERVPSEKAGKEYAKNLWRIDHPGW